MMFVIGYVSWKVRFLSVNGTWSAVAYILNHVIHVVSRVVFDASFVSIYYKYI